MDLEKEYLKQRNKRLIQKILQPFTTKAISKILLWSQYFIHLIQLD